MRRKLKYDRARVKARIAFVGNFEYNCGSSNALLGYVRAGNTLGHDIRISEFSCIDKIIRNSIPIADKDWQPDLFVIVYESYPFLSQNDIDKICLHIPRFKRVLIDPDGKYLKPNIVQGDTNHPAADSYKQWTTLYNSLSDIILQPSFETSLNRKVHPFLYFAIDNHKSYSNRKSKDFDLIYVGNNWYRWQDIYSLIKVLTPIRSRLKRVALFGQYWSGKLMQGYEDATYSDPKFLKRNQIEIYESVPFDHVESTMSQGLLNPILIRPILNNLGMLTPRMFETLAADTVTLIPKYFTHALNLYGNDAAQLTLSDNAAEDIIRILDNYKIYKKLSEEIREMLITQHSYEIRLNQLLQFT